MLNSGICVQNQKERMKVAGLRGLKGKNMLCGGVGKGISNRRENGLQVGAGNFRNVAESAKGRRGLNHQNCSMKKASIESVPRWNNK